VLYLEFIRDVLPCHAILQIKEVALVTDKVTKKRRGFIFVTYESEDSVDKCTEQTFHNVEGTQVSFQLNAVYCIYSYSCLRVQAKKPFTLVPSCGCVYIVFTPKGPCQNQGRSFSSLSYVVHEIFVASSSCIL
jgi:RNA recognition motif-containing protein